ncbi:MAG: hypothetical protein HYY40_09595 [Bacteroidetes bacterium]|nr:hypothetical protein [Bacteroidota bacterium]
MFHLYAFCGLQDTFYMVKDRIIPAVMFSILMVFDPDRYRDAKSNLPDNGLIRILASMAAVDKSKSVTY